MSQKQRLIEFLKVHRHINPLQAWQILGIYRLSSTILELRKDGHKITTMRMNVKNQFGEECHVANYVLED